MNKLPEERDPLIQISFPAIPLAYPTHDVVGPTFNSSTTGYLPKPAPGESYEDHIKHLNKLNRFLYG
jgi:hypothetical protein